MTVPTVADDTELQMPEWMPGYYVIGKYGKSVADLLATDAQGNALNVKSVDDHTWRVHCPKGSTFSLFYEVPIERDGSAYHYSGACTYMYVVGRKEEKCALHFDLPQGMRVAVGLDGTNYDYTAPSYDVLADNPVTFGDFREATYTVAGKVHTVTVRGSGAAEMDLAKLKTECEEISTLETDFFGGAPYTKYVWHFIAYSGSGMSYGIEHLSSNEISLSTHLDPGTATLLSHEFFHLWNVKRIRSRVLGPFDYTKLPRTGALWWLEGVTDYYAHGLVRRYGMNTDVEFFGTITGDLRRLESQPAHLTVSPYESSYRVADANEGRGNSDGYGISYYESGFLIGLCLDIELLSTTDGARSLDDVIKGLWRECRDGRPGFEEDGIRQELVEVGGPEFGPLYDKLVLEPGELPVAEELAKVGLRLVGSGDRFSIRAGDTVTPQQIRLREIWLAKHRSHA
jgi:predicted metalloprotease with PDZ domain